MVSEDLQDPTGFVDREQHCCELRAGARTISLTHTAGILYYYWHGGGVRLLTGIRHGFIVRTPDTTMRTILYSNQTGLTLPGGLSAWDLVGYLLVSARVTGDIHASGEGSRWVIPWQVHELMAPGLLGNLPQKPGGGGGLVGGTFA